MALYSCGRGSSWHYWLDADSYTQTLARKHSRIFRPTLSAYLQAADLQQRKACSREQQQASTTALWTKQ